MSKRNNQDDTSVDVVLKKQKNSETESTVTKTDSNLETGDYSQPYNTHYTWDDTSTISYKYSSSDSEEVEYKPNITYINESESENNTGSTESESESESESENESENENNTGSSESERNKSENNTGSSESESNESENNTLKLGDAVKDVVLLLGGGKRRKKRIGKKKLLTDDPDEEDEYDVIQEILIERYHPDDMEKYKPIKKYIKDTEPDISKVLNEPLKMEDKARLVQLMEVYENIPESTDDRLYFRDKICREFKKFRKEYKDYSYYTSEQHQEMSLTEKRIEDINVNVSYKYQILTLETTDYNKAVIMSKYKEMMECDKDNDDYIKLKTWIDCAVSLPYNRVKVVPSDNLTRLLFQVKDRLDMELFGMKKVKEQILLFLHSRIANPEVKCSLGLIGCPGVGKTAISRLLASVLDFPFEQISFGGVRDSSFLKGHSYTYVGSKPGVIVDSLRRMKYKNGILFLDEYDKISHNRDICSALLHITDPVQNSDFRDNYLGNISVDLSDLWFIYAMNELPEDSALRDRIFTIEVDGYTGKDKIAIIQKYLLPKITKRLKAEGCITINNENAGFFVNRVCSMEDRGVRTIEKELGNICNKIDFAVRHGDISKFDVSFNPEKVLTYPLEITEDLISSMIPAKQLDPAISRMYM